MIAPLFYYQETLSNNIKKPFKMTFLKQENAGFFFTMTFTAFCRFVFTSIPCKKIRLVPASIHLCGPRFESHPRPEFCMWIGFLVLT